MPRSDRFYVTVSPPTFDRTAFAGLDEALDAPHAPFDRGWLMARFAEGLEIRMLRDPLRGFVAFQPGRLSWRPIVGADQTVVVHDLRVAPGPDAKEASHRLWAAVEGFAQYYGYDAVLALTGTEEGLIGPHLAPSRPWIAMDHGPGDTALIGKILQGPMSLPCLPRDWRRRAARCGAGPVIQTTGESLRLERRADQLQDVLTMHGMPTRHHRFRDADSARHQATSPGALFSIILNGERVGGADMSDADILRAAQAARETIEV